MNIGDKLKNLREYYGYSQTDIAKLLSTTQRNISYYESMPEITGLLDYIHKICSLFKINLSDFFLENIDDLKSSLPDYITPADAAVLRILNTSIDIKARIEIKEAFLHIMKAVLVNYADKLGHMPEYQALFGGGESMAAEPKSTYTVKKD